MSKIVVLHIDALGHDLFKSSNFNFSQSLFNKTSFRMQTLGAYLGNIATLYSGLYPEKHGIWTAFWRNPDDSPFKSFPLPLLKACPMQFRGKFVRGVSYLKGYPNFTWNRIPLESLKYFSTSIKYKLHAQNVLPVSIFDLMRNSNIRFKYISASPFFNPFNKARQYIMKKYDFIYCSVVSLDTVLHRHDPTEELVIECINSIDREIKGIYETLKEECGDDFILILLSDHGMTKVNKTYNVIEKVAPYDGQYFLDSTIARFWPGTKKSKERIFDIAEEQDISLVDEKKSKQLKLGRIDPRYGEVNLVAKPGTIFLPNYFQGNNMVRGMHGYDSKDCPELDCIFAVHDPQDRFSGTGTAEMVDFCPTILDFFKLKIPDIVQGEALF